MHEKGKFTWVARKSVRQMMGRYRTKNWRIPFGEYPMVLSMQENALGELFLRRPALRKKYYASNSADTVPLCCESGAWPNQGMLPPRSFAISLPLTTTDAAVFWSVFSLLSGSKCQWRSTIWHQNHYRLTWIWAPLPKPYALKGRKYTVGMEME